MGECYTLMLAIAQRLLHTVVMANELISLIHRRSGTAVERFGPYAIEALILPHEEARGTVYRVRIEPRSATAVSQHRIAEEYYFVLEGSGVAVLDGAARPIARGDFLRLPPGTTHAFETLEEPLELLNIHTPGCRPDRDTYFIGAIPPGFAEPPGS